MTIDTKEFGHLMGKLIDAVQDMETSLPYDTARANLVAHIDAQLSSARAAGREEAAKLCKPGLIANATAYEIAAIEKCAENIRALATQVAPTQAAPISQGVTTSANPYNPASAVGEGF